MRVSFGYFVRLFCVSAVRSGWRCPLRCVDVAGAYVRLSDLIGDHQVCPFLSTPSGQVYSHHCAHDASWLVGWLVSWLVGWIVVQAGDDARVTFDAVVDMALLFRPGIIEATFYVCSVWFSYEIYSDH